MSLQNIEIRSESESSFASTSIESGSMNSPKNEDYHDDEDGKSDEDENTIYVGDLPVDTDSKFISNLFDRFGDVTEIQMKMIRGIKFPFGYAFVKYADKDSAKAAFQTLNGTVVGDGSCLRLGWAKRNRRLHVGNLDPEVEEDDLRHLFEPFGTLTELDGVTLFRRESPGFTNYAHIHFEQRESAAVARAKLNHFEFKGRNLRVEWNRVSKKLFHNLKEDEFDQRPFHPLPVVSVYLQFETVEPESRVSEAVIREVFEPYGRVTGCFIKSNYIQSNGRRQYGYAFVHFECTVDGQECASRAASEIGNGENGVHIHKGVAFRCEVSKNYRRASAMLSRGADATDGISFGRSYHSFGRSYHPSGHSYHPFGPRQGQVHGNGQGYFKGGNQVTNGRCLDQTSSPDWESWASSSYPQQYSPSFMNGSPSTMICGLDDGSYSHMQPQGQVPFYGYQNGPMFPCSSFFPVMHNGSGMAQYYASTPSPMNLMMAMSPQAMTASAAQSDTMAFSPYPTVPNSNASATRNGMISGCYGPGSVNSSVVDGNSQLGFANMTNQAAQPLFVSYGMHPQMAHAPCSIAVPQAMWSKPNPSHQSLSPTHMAGAASMMRSPFQDDSPTSRGKSFR